MDQGVHFNSASIPFSQNVFNKTGLKPDSILEFSVVDKLGNPFVERKFQNNICGGLYGALWSILLEQLDNERYTLITEILENMEK
jgi:hypothetical protein